MRASTHRRSPPAAPDQPAPRRGPTPAWGWAALVLVLAILVLGVLGGVVALAYSPLAAGLFGPGEPEEPAPDGQIDGVPAPDSTIDQADASFEHRAERVVGPTSDGKDGPREGPPPPIEGLDAPLEGPR